MPKDFWKRTNDAASKAGHDANKASEANLKKDWQSKQASRGGSQIARDAGRNPETRAHGFASELALAEAIEGREASACALPTSDFGRSPAYIGWS